MTVPIEFLSLVINRTALDSIFEGGSEAFIKMNGPFDGRVKAYDESLIKFGAMSSNDILEIADFLESIGLVGVSRCDGEEMWTDFCVLDELMGPTLRCDWIHYSSESRTVSFAP